jgi:hypothetical protein
MPDLSGGLADRDLQQTQKPPRPKEHTNTHTLLSGTGVWVYRSGVWELSDDYSDPGYEPGGPPIEPGEYEGQVVRKASVRSNA